MSRPERRTLVRLALTPRWLMMAGLVLLFAATAVLLGRWQWDRTQDILAAERAAAQEAVPLEQVLPPGGPGDLPSEGVGRPVTVVGTFDPAHQVAVTNREQDGRAGVWIVTGLRVADGRTVAVLRGWLPTADAPGATVPDGTVTVSGVLQPDETFYADAQSPPGTVAAIAHSRLATLWSTTVVPGFVVLQSVTPESAPAPVPVTPTAQTGDVAFPLQNFVYAFQWWLFALFALVVYVRWLWLEAGRVDTVDYGGAS